ncbi:PP2C family serine/threonine-protein phosphatase [Demequina sp. NBRC 110054]|uniref:PP2C family protein-serine/threonine phosphatase n=1 Tax=Demequina sp. NBRC 110054 TaxID=1570343 RepID=UPI000A012AEE|nr:protein phosphatase 2C domain-containing protein [Demequina sp. NBRC 110054]
MTAPITVAAGSATHTGLRRKLNEDSVLAQHPVFLVADGMGGYEAGELASAAAIHEFEGMSGRDSVTVEEIRGALSRARLAVGSLPVDSENGAGTTVTGAFVAEHAGAGYWIVVNIGDSRTYRLVDGAIRQISVDHSVVQEMVDEGQLTPAQARTHHDRNIVTRAIGAGSSAEADFWLMPAAVGDRLVVCSDGLSGEVDDAGIAAALASASDPQDAADALVAAALARGGRDNVSVIVLDAIAVARGEQEIDEADDDTVPRVTEEATDVSL